MSEDDLLNQLDLVKEIYHFGQERFIIERVRNLDQLIENVSDDEFNIDERLPYWAELWPSAIGLSRYLSQHSDFLLNKSVLELGCGLGLTSLVSAVQNPSRHLLTDYEPESLILTRRNFALNNMEVPDMCLLDWRHPVIEERFERIVASDVVYEERFFEPLVKVFKFFIQPGGIIILAEPNRSIGTKFFSLLKNSGFQSQVCDEIVVQDGLPIRVSIHLISINNKQI